MSRSNLNMTNDQIIGLIEEALEVEPGSLHVDTSISSVEEWSSIGWLTIVSALDERLGLHLAAKTIRGFQTAGDVIEYVAAHQTNAS